MNQNMKKFGIILTIFILPPILAFGIYLIYNNYIQDTFNELNKRFSNYTFNYLKALNKVDKIEDINAYNLSTHIFTYKNQDFDILILNNNKLIIYNSKNIAELNYQKFIIDNLSKIYSPIIEDNFIYKQNKKIYKISYKRDVINNKEYTVIIIFAYDKLKSQNKLISLLLFSFAILSSIIGIYLYKKLYQFTKKEKENSSQTKLEKKNILFWLNKKFSFFFIITDKTGKITDINDNLIELLGHEKDDIIGSFIQILLNFDTEEPFEEFLDQIEMKEFKLKDYKGNNVYFTIKISGYYNEIMKQTDYIFVLTNITEHKEKSNKLNVELTKLRTLYSISEVMTLIPEPQIIFEKMFDYTRQIVNYKYATLFKVENNKLFPIYTNNPSITNLINNFSLNIGEGIAGLVAKTLKGTIINNAQDSAIAVQIPNTEDINENIISVPLLTKGELTGVMSFSREDGVPYTKEDLHILELLASQAANVIHNSMLIKKLTTSEEKYRSLINASPVGIFILDDGKICFVNNTFIDLVETIPQKLLGEDFINVINPADRDKFTEHLTHFMMSNNDELFQVRLQNPKVDFLVVEIGLKQIVWEGKSTIMGTAIDVTEKISLNKQLLQTQKLESMGILAGGIAHDFKNILTAVIGASDMLLLKSPVNSEYYKYGSIIKQSAERGASLAKRLLVYSREDSEEVKIFDLNEIIEEVIAIAKYTVTQQIKLDVQLDSSELIFEGDPVKIQQCILNLVVNAKDAMDGRGVLSIKSEFIDNILEKTQSELANETLNYALIEVKDTGCGIDEETMKKIFSPFFTTKEIGKGTGLGLSTTNSIIRNYNGIIDVESEINVGTTFKIYLPLSNKKVERTEEEMNVMQNSARSILLVDDEEIILNIASEMLFEFGNEVTTCTRGSEALNLLRQNHNYDLIIIDRMMPEIDGIELFHKIKELNDDLKIVMASGNLDEETEKQLKKEGLFEFISKPFKMSDLSNLLNKLNEKQ